MLTRLLRDTVAVRAVAAVLIGVAVASTISAEFGWRYALTGWIAAAAVYVSWTWIVVAGMDAKHTAAHATREDPTRVFTDVLVVLASFASLGGVAYLLIAEANQANPISAGAIGVVSVFAAWIAVHTLFMLHYARLYYSETPGGIGFNQNAAPRYADFAYVAFTVGMTYQVSDTNIQNSMVRKAVLRQALVSYLLGAVIIAVTVNLIAGMGKG